MSSNANPIVVSWAPDRLDIFVRGANSGVFHKSWNGQTWLPSPMGWDLLDLSGVLSRPAVVAWPSSRLDVFVISTDNVMYHKYRVPWVVGQPPSWTGWESLGGVFTSPPVVTSWGPNRLDIFGLGTNTREMFHKAGDSSGWYPSQTDWEPLGGEFTSAPAVASWGPNRLDVFGLGTDQSMYHKFWDTDHWGPGPPDASQWEPLGGSFTSAPVVVSRASERLDIFGRGQGFGMFHKSWNGQTWLPSPMGWDALGEEFSGPFLRTTSAVASWGPNRVDVFGLGLNREMLHRYWENGAWLHDPDWEDLGGEFTSPPAVASWGPNRLDVFGLGTDHAMYHKGRNTVGWAQVWEPLGGNFSSWW